MGYNFDMVTVRDVLNDSMRQYREAVAPPAVRTAVHLNSNAGMKRKRIQPRGSKECATCGKPISANKWRCWECEAGQ